MSNQNPQNPQMAAIAKYLQQRQKQSGGTNTGQPVEVEFVPPGAIVPTDTRAPVHVQGQGQGGQMTQPNQPNQQQLLAALQQLMAQKGGGQQPQQRQQQPQQRQQQPQQPQPQQPDQTAALAMQQMARMMGQNQLTPNQALQFANQFPNAVLQHQQQNMNTAQSQQMAGLVQMIQQLAQSQQAMAAAIQQQQQVARTAPVVQQAAMLPQVGQFSNAVYNAQPFVAGHNHNPMFVGGCQICGKQPRNLAKLDYGVNPWALPHLLWNSAVAAFKHPKNTVFMVCATAGAIAIVGGIITTLLTGRQAQMTLGDPSTWGQSVTRQYIAPGTYNAVGMERVWEERAAASSRAAKSTNKPRGGGYY